MVLPLLFLTVWMLSIDGSIFPALLLISSGTSSDVSEVVSDSPSRQTVSNKGMRESWVKSGCTTVRYWTLMSVSGTRVGKDEL